MDLVIGEIKKRLKKEDCGHLKVRRGRGLESCWIIIHRQNPGEMLSIREEERIAKVFGDKREGGGGNCHVILGAVAEMKLGFREKKPICEVCGRVFREEEDVRDCLLSH